MTAGTLSNILIMGLAFLIAAILFDWFRIVDKVAVWIVARISKNIPNFFKGLF